MSLLNLKAPAYLQRAAKRKWGNRITVQGAYQSELDKFFAAIHYRAVRFDERPRKIANQIVDIDAKEHINDGEIEDEIEIKSMKSKDQSNKKSYQLFLGKTWGFGGSVNVGAQFFNVAAASPSISAGFGLNYSRTKEETTQEETSESLSQEYGVVGKLKIPPKSKLKVRITTSAATYEATTTTELSMPASLAIPVRYRGRFGCCQVIGSITAQVGN